MNSDLYLAFAHITHHRYQPKPHSFEYDMGYLMMDIDELPKICKQSPFWSYNRFNLVSLYDQDLLHIGKDSPIENKKTHAVRQALEGALQTQLGYTLRTSQKVYVLTLPRYIGISFNPVSFYWVYSEDNKELECIAAHITNTPWHEQHLYCFKCTEESKEPSTTPDSSQHRYTFDKRFHVSPFMPMFINYDWRFKFTHENKNAPSVIHMQLKKGNELLFEATMRFNLAPMSIQNQNLYPVDYPLQSFKIIGAIYWQAFRLLLKRIPFYTHPKKLPPSGPAK